MIFMFALLMGVPLPGSEGYKRDVKARSGLAGLLKMSPLWKSLTLLSTIRSMICIAQNIVAMPQTLLTASSALMRGLRRSNLCRAEKTFLFL